MKGEEGEILTAGVSRSSPPGSQSSWVFNPTKQKPLSLRKVGAQVNLGGQKSRWDRDLWGLDVNTAVLQFE